MSDGDPGVSITGVPTAPGGESLALFCLHDLLYSVKGAMPPYAVSVLREPMRRVDLQRWEGSSIQ